MLIYWYNVPSVLIFVLYFVLLFILKYYIIFISWYNIPSVFIFVLFVLFLQNGLWFPYFSIICSITFKILYNVPLTDIISLIPIILIFYYLYWNFVKVSVMNITFSWFGHIDKYNRISCKVKISCFYLANFLHVFEYNKFIMKIIVLCIPVLRGGI